MIRQAQPLCQIAVVEEPLAQQALSAATVLEEFDLRRHADGRLQHPVVLQCRHLSLHLLHEHGRQPLARQRHRQVEEVRSFHQRSWLACNDDVWPSPETHWMSPVSQ